MSRRNVCPWLQGMPAAFPLLQRGLIGRVPQWPDLHWVEGLSAFCFTYMMADGQLVDTQLRASRYLKSRCGRWRLPGACIPSSGRNFRWTAMAPWLAGEFEVLQV